MGFEGSQIAVTVTHTIIPREGLSIESQIAAVEYALVRQFAGNKDLHIKVQQVDVYSAERGSFKDNA